ncbi:ABC transporter permease [Fusibacter ferrireducens]|uniref:ABC transporter permease n=1 Tax=Fusibacter ferrireducens TaxID=2785058 RepID=A0ABR9ZNY6_9FIRM|nr:ABC transporter permease [Fusibacter ferrireducens]MBF4692156.1 ABC transporter permease [Fusibacter ferrireducens]
MNILGYCKKILYLVNKQKAFLALILMFTAMLFFKTNFYTPFNLINLMKSGSVLLILAFGITIVLVAGGADLSIGGVMVVSGIVAIKLMNVNVPMAIAIICALLVGVVVGMINAFFSVYQKTEPFIITLGMGMLLTGIAQQLTDAHPVASLNPEFVLLSNGKLFNQIPNQVIVMFGVFVLTFFILRYTSFGRNCYAIGGDYEVAKYSGINVMRTKALAYVYSGVIAALGGIMLSSMLNSGNSTYGENTALLVNCGVVVGGTSFAGGIGGAQQSLIGLLVFAVLQNSMNMVGVDSYVQLLFQGIVTVGIIWLDSYGRKKRRETV